MMANDYQRIEQAIHYLERRFREQPRLEQVAAEVGLSEFHFQRMFQRWAGISPKRFLQYLTADYAEQLLLESKNLLDVTYAAGLSSPSRLHGLFVSLHAVTPAEWRSRGQGLCLRYGLQPSPFGPCFIAASPRGICALGFADHGLSAPLAALRAEWPAAELREDAAGTRRLAQQIFAPDPAQAPLHVWVRGTNFQIKVWEALLRIPPGAAAAYEDVAAAIDAPRAVRAVGTALAQNRVGYLIPCHRVIRKTGTGLARFGNYRWGPLRKRAMLGREAALRGLSAEDWALAPASF